MARRITVKLKKIFINGNFKVQNYKVERAIFFSKKNLRIHFDVVFDFELNGRIFDSLTPFGGELWLF